MLNVKNQFGNSLFLIALIFWLFSCKKNGEVHNAFYYWKSEFRLDNEQYNLLKQTANNTLYIRFFDIGWDSTKGKAFPDAIITFGQPTYKINITPVIFISNKTFENIKITDVDSLAINSFALITRLAANEKIGYSKIQVDCDWTLTTKERYFSFLKALKKISQKQLETTIRLHQVKYKDRTGVPPVDNGVLMFYNMGKLNANPNQANSIYNEADAAKYVSYTSQYPLHLDIALPLFSWSIQIREGRVIQVYGNIGKKQLNDQPNFYGAGNIFRAKKSFFFEGVYIKENDIFKLEQTDIYTLKKAAKQLSSYLLSQKNTTIIYYELGNIKNSEFKAQTLNEVSADF